MNCEDILENIVKVNGSRMSFADFKANTNHLSQGDISLGLDILTQAGRASVKDGFITLAGYNHNPSPVVEADAPAQEDYKPDDSFLIKRMGEVRKLDEHTVFNQFLVNHGFFICRETSELYRFDVNSMQYIHYDTKMYRDYVVDNIISQLGYDLKDNIISDGVKNLHKYVSINYNIIIFNNGYFDTSAWKFHEGESYTECIPYMNLDYNYNPNAVPGEYFNLYWNNYSAELQQELMEVFGYMFLKGNPRKKFIVLVGWTDSGKTVFTYLMEDVFGRVSHVSLGTLAEGKFGLSPLINSRINIMNDESSKGITETKVIKIATGDGDKLVVPIKYKEPIELDYREIPKFVCVMNNLAKFPYDEALIGRLGIVALNTKRPLTQEEKDDSLKDNILSEKESMEWLIYNSLEAVKSYLAEPSKSKWDMKNPEHRGRLEKYTQPIRYFLQSGFTVDESCFTQHKLGKNGRKYDSKHNYYVTVDEMRDFLDKASLTEVVEIIDRDGANGEIKRNVVRGFLRHIIGDDDYNITTESKSKKKCFKYLRPTKYFVDLMGENHPAVLRAKELTGDEYQLGDFKQI